MASVGTSPSEGSIRAHSMENRTAFCPESATSLQSSTNRFQESQARPLGSAALVPGACSCSHQSVFVLFPSDWCAAMADPHRKSSGKVRVATLGRVALRFQSLLQLVHALLHLRLHRHCPRRGWHGSLPHLRSSCGTKYAREGGTLHELMESAREETADGGGPIQRLTAIASLVTTLDRRVVELFESLEE